MSTEKTNFAIGRIQEKTMAGKIPTQLKAASGYILLIILLFVTVRYIYGEMTAMTQTDKYSELIYKRWRTTSGLANKLYQLEITSQSIRSGFSRHNGQYEKAVKEVNMSIDSLRVLLTDSIQIGRLDSVRILLEEKDKQVKDIYGIVKQLQSNYVYQQHIERLIAEQDTIVTHPKVHNRTVTETHSYKVREKEGFFKRVRNVFVPSKADSTHISQVTTQISVDSTEKDFNPADTVATMLKAVHHKAEDTRHSNIRRLDSRIRTLMARGQELNNKVNGLMATIEEEEHALATRHSGEQKEIQQNSARTMAAIAAAAVLLAVFFLIMIWRDITHSNLYRRELERAKAKAEDLLEQREQLMLTITHDIKAPASSLLGYTDLLTAEDSRQKSYIANMKASARHLIDMVGSLLDYHRLDAKKMDLNLIPFKPLRLFDDIYESFCPMAVAKNLDMEYQCGINASRTFISDPSRIRQITENLLSNALKFTEKGSISLAVEYDSGRLRISVCDTGCGIAREDKEKMFKEFTRLANAQGREGFGLGLSITSKMTMLLGGEVTVESAEGKGSEFCVVLPMEEQTVESCENTEIDTGIRLLVIDDDRLQLRLTADMLASKGIDVTCCMQPEEMLLLLNEQEFDAVLTDIQMPAMNGFELIRQIRAIPAGCSASIPVIAVTARSDMNIKELRSHGFAACLHKPYTIGELLAAIMAGIQTKENLKPDFSMLIAFAGDDKEAAKEIIRTFVEETRKNILKIEEASNDNDVETITLVAHKMLPLFIQIGAANCTPSLEWLEAQRGKKEYTKEIDRHAETIIRAAYEVIKEAERLYSFSS